MGKWESIGALWVKENDKGKYMSGKIDLTKLTLEGDELVIVINKTSRKFQEGNSNRPQYEVITPEENLKTEGKESKDEAQGSSDDDIPF